MELISKRLSLFSFSPTDETPKDDEEEQWKDTPSEVVHLTDDTFDDYLAANPSVLVMFYAPCKYSKTCTWLLSGWLLPPPPF